MKRKSALGYTLIELLVGMSIIAIIFTVGVAGFRGFSRRQALTGVLKTVKADIRMAQQKALTGEKPTGNCPMLTGYSFTVVSANSYSIIANCTIDSLTTQNYTIKTVNLSSKNITISPVATAIKFKVLGHGTDLAGTQVITMTHTLLGVSNTISIGSGGSVD